MDWNIYSVGDSYFLQQVLNAIAAICGTDDFSTACSIALLVGVIIICIQTVIRGQGLNIQTAIICYIMWFICYYPTTSVNIHDVYTQEDRKVDNVPIGVAAAGSIISTFGFKVTEMMETAFQMPEATSTLTGGGAGNGGRYGNALYYLNSIYRMGPLPDLAISIDEMQGDNPGDFSRSVAEYAHYCTFKALQLGPQYGGKTQAEVYNAPIAEALRFDSDVYYTQVWTAGEPRDYTCGDAWDVIYQRFDNSLSGSTSGSDYMAGIALLLGIAERDPTAAWDSARGFDFQRATWQAMNALRIDAKHAMNFMLASITWDIYRSGLGQGYKDMFDRTSAVMLNQAIAQRNMQWAAEQNMFFDTMRPMMSFIEGFVYAITPFAAFIMLLGVFGLRLYFKYFIMLIWVQLWLPVVAICNMFIMSGATRDLGEFALGGKDPTSFYALNKISETVATWISVGGMFTAAVPLLTFIVVSGSAFALTSLTNRMAGADHINEKIASPDVVSPNAGLSMAALNQGDAMKAVLSGAKELSPSINLGQIAQETANKARQEAFTASTSFFDTFNRAFNKSGGFSSNKADNAMFSDAVSASRSHSFGTAISEVMGTQTAQQYGLTEDQARTLALALGAGFIGKAEAGIKTSNGYTLEQAYNAIKGEEFRFSEAAQSQVGNVLASSYQKSASQGAQFSIGSEMARSLQNQASRVSAASETASAADQFASSIGVTQSVKLVDAVGAMSDSTANWFSGAYQDFKSSLSDAERQVLEAGEKKFTASDGSPFTNPIAAQINALLEYQNQEGKDETLMARSIAFSALRDTPMMSGAGERFAGIYQEAYSGVNGVVPQVPRDSGVAGASSSASGSATAPAITTSGGSGGGSSAGKPIAPVQEPAAGSGVPTVDISKPSPYAGGAPGMPYPGDGIFSSSTDVFLQQQAAVLNSAQEQAVQDLTQINAGNNATVAAAGDANDAVVEGAGRSKVVSDAVGLLNEVRVQRDMQNSNKDYQMPDALKTEIFSTVQEWIGFDPASSTVGRNDAAQTYLSNAAVNNNIGNNLDFSQNLKNLYNSAADAAKSDGFTADFLTGAEAQTISTPEVMAEKRGLEVSRQAQSTYEALMNSEDFGRVAAEMKLDEAGKERYARDIVHMTVGAGAGSATETNFLLFTTKQMERVVR